MLYSNEQFNNIYNSMPKIVESLEKYKNNILEPTQDEFDTIINIIIKYIIKKQRIIYGGYALNLLIKKRNIKDAIYKDGINRADVEFYTPEPLEDLYNICNLIYNSGFKHVIGRQAMHEESYKIAANFQEYCDITYVPINVYSKMRTKLVTNILLTNPTFIYVDRYRMFNDAFGSAWRWNKEIKRFYLLQKYYPLTNNISKCQIDNKHVKHVIDFIESKFLKTTNTVVIFGHYAYNYYLDKSKTKKHNIINVPHIDVISINYVQDSIKLYKLLVKEYGQDIEKVEYYPFFQYTGMRCCFMYKQIMVANIYDNNNKCIPYKTVNNMKIGTFTFVLMMLLIMEFYTYVNKYENDNTIYKTLISNLINFRNYYLKSQNKTVLDKTPFEEFTIPCTGTTIVQDRLFLLDLMKKKEQGKMLIFKYEPHIQRKQKLNLNFKYANTSGKKINKEHNLQIKNSP